MEAFAQCLASGDAWGAEAIVEELLLTGASATVVLARLVQPAMEHIGVRWERSELTVADEHLATTIAHEVLAILYERLLVAPGSSRGRVLLAGVESDRHVLGLRMVADVLEGAGYEVVYLGADVPTEALLAAVERHRPAVVGLSATLTLMLPPLERALDRLAERFPETSVLVGGVAGALLEPDRPTVHVLSDVTLVREVVDAIPTAAEPATSTEAPQAASTAPRPRPSDDPEALYSDAISHVADLARLHARRAKRLQVMALEDALTGLWNRRAFDDRVLELVGDATQLPLAMLLLDVDRFKQVNDTFGHQVGDQALQQVATHIREVLREADFAARLGGDEFVVLLPATGLDDAVAIAERIRSSVEADADPAFTVSIGVEQLSSDIRASILGADTSLYRAKGSGRNSVCAVA